MKKGFTLLEILLVIAAIGILAAIVIVAINPRRQLAQVRNVERESEINAIFSAVQQYAIDNSEYPPGLENYYQDICISTVTSNCIDLTVLVPTYLVSIPEDPQSGLYKVALNPNNGRVSIIAPDSELALLQSINPFGLISSWEDLHAVRDDLAGSYLQTRDLLTSDPDYNMYASISANSGAGWDPIGTNITPFTGRYDGGGYMIEGLTIERPTENFVALFADSLGGEVLNLGLSGGAVEGAAFTAGLVGNNRGLVSNCWSSVDVVGNNLTGQYVAGLVAENRVDTSGSELRRGIVEGSFSSGSVTNVNGYGRAGGLVGRNWGGIIQTSYATGDVSGIGGPWVGGLVAINYNDQARAYDAIINDSYSRGDVQGEFWVGGLVGENGVSDFFNSGTTSIINRSFSTGVPTASSEVGGLVGRQGEDRVIISPSVNNSYWDTDTSGTFTSAGGTGLTTFQMQQQSSFTGWDFGSIWSMNGSTNDGYPFIQSEI